jgi:DNA anti-recombination protein RmuC
MAVETRNAVEGNEAIEKLQILLGTLNKSHAEIGSSSDQLNVQDGELQGICDSIATSTDAVEQFLNEMSTQVEAEESESLAQLDAWEQATSEGINKIEMAHQGIAEGQQTLVSEVNDTWEEVGTAWTQADDAFTQCLESCDSAEEQLTQGSAEFKTMFVDLGEASSQHQEQVTAFQTNAESDFEDFDNELAGSHTEAIESCFNEFSQQLTQDQMSVMTDHFDELGTNLTERAGAFITEAESLGDDLAQRCSEIMQNLTDHVGNELEETLKEVIAGLVEDAITALLNEVIEGGVLMTAGAATTGTLAPILPGLKAAELALKAINAILDAIPFT